MTKSQSRWRNRILRYGMLPARDFVANPRNPRQHPESQRRAVKASLDTLGWVAPVIVNARTGYLLDGHERVWQALAKDEDAEIPFVEVDLDENEETQFLLTFDYTTYLANYDAQMLQELVARFESDNRDVTALVNDLLAKHGSTSDNPYTTKIPNVVYEPTGRSVTLAQLVDTRKYDELIASIDADSDLSDDEKAFLRLAAARHLRFDYSNIAEFYAQARAELQRHFERSFLVVVDFGDAVARGYVTFVKRIRELVEEYYDNEQDAT